MAITANNISIDEIASVLGCKYDLASIRDCDDINPWARYKPINYNLEANRDIDPWDETGDLTGTQRIEVNWGLCAPGYLTFITDITIGTARGFTWTGDYPKWGVHRPDDNVRAVMRLRDFIGYEHYNAPDFSISLDQDVYEGTVFTTGLEYIPAQYSTGGKDLNVIDLSDITVSDLGSINNWYVWYIFYQQDSNGKYSSVAACNTGVMVKNCTANMHHPEVNDSSKYLKEGQTYTMMACASPTSSGYEVDRVYPILQVSISMVPLTLSSNKAMVTFTVNEADKPNAEGAKDYISLASTNGYQGEQPMEFTTSGQVVTWENMQVTINSFNPISGESAADFRLTLVDSNGNAISDCFMDRYDSIAQWSYLSPYSSKNNLKPRFENFTSYIDNIYGVLFEVYYKDAYYPITTVRSKNQ